jgi:hypothetical protein
MLHLTIFQSKPQTGFDYVKLYFLTFLLRYVVGVYSKNTREIKLCNIEQLYVMQQTVKGIHENTDEGRGEVPIVNINIF